VVWRSSPALDNLKLSLAVSPTSMLCVGDGAPERSDMGRKQARLATQLLTPMKELPPTTAYNPLSRIELLR